MSDKLINCKICNSVTEKSSPNKIYCSRKCNQKASTARELVKRRNRPESSKKCLICGTSFYVIGVKKTCSKKCSKILYKEWNRSRWINSPNKRLEKNRKRREKYKLVVKDITYIKCSECENNFIKDKSKKTCSKECSRVRKNRISHIYRTNNRNKIRLTKKEKLKSDPMFNLRERVSGLIRSSLKNKGFNKNKKARNILKCSILDFKNYLSVGFKNNYNVDWDDRFYSIIHLDHIIPVSSAKTEDEVIKLNHFTNFQYLYKWDNQEKSNKLNWKLNLKNTTFFKEPIVIEVLNENCK